MRSLSQSPSCFYKIHCFEIISVCLGVISSITRGGQVGHKLQMLPKDVGVVL